MLVLPVVLCLRPGPLRVVGRGVAHGRLCQETKYRLHNTLLLFMSASKNNCSTRQLPGTITEQFCWSLLLVYKYMTLNSSVRERVSEVLDTSDSLFGGVHPQNIIVFIQVLYAKMSISIKYLDENNNILGADTSELTIRGVQNLENSSSN